MSDLEWFCKAMDGEWVVERYELQDDKDLHVYYRSLSHPTIVWSHKPFDFERVPAVGTVGRIGFLANKGET